MYDAAYSAKAVIVTNHDYEQKRGIEHYAEKTIRFVIYRTWFYAVVIIQQRMLLTSNHRYGNYHKSYQWL